MPLRIAGRLFLLAFAIIILLPLIFLIVTTIKDQQQFYASPLGIPSSFTGQNYSHLFDSQPMLSYFSNSITVSFSTVVLELIVSSMIAYGIYRIANRLGLILYGIFLIGLMVPAQVNMIPIYSFMRDLGLMNSRFGLILVTVSMLLPVAVFMLTGFMRALPKEMFEAGSMDGAGEWRLYSQIALPLSAPSLAATAIFLLVSVWNDLLFPMLLLTDKAKMTLPLALLQFQGEYSTNYPGLLTGVVLISLPMLILFLLLQRYFISGMAAGSLKG
ncbi:ABC transporter permease [Paenibacillus sp. BIHB 4019]|uniref:ABC transporter permease n=1 Tax=Paenibacillus sp. BIHB 4019 TaxID=1870819 RepID=A0A1B2DCJ4_9BACL|nr:carbohydrate ABC transporter permease [Paenibacillus sp. BIHB 4019]ANY65450.1 ABC transporter permease [Paenibacillus sp. BIHB 4019]